MQRGANCTLQDNHRHLSPNENSKAVHRCTAQLKYISSRCPLSIIAARPMNSNHDEVETALMLGRTKKVAGGSIRAGTIAVIPACKLQRNVARVFWSLEEPLYEPATTTQHLWRHPLRHAAEAEGDEDGQTRALGCPATRGQASEGSGRG